MKALFLLSVAALFSYTTAVCPSPVSAKTINLIEQFEGFVALPRPDPIGFPTVDYGHLCKTKGCSKVPFKFPLTKANAESLLHSGLTTCQNCVNSDINQSVHLNDNQYGAVVSWAFNVGCRNINTSLLVKRLNEGEDPNTFAAQELPQWNKGGGKVLPGLVKHRAAEVKLFQTLSSVSAHPC